MSGSPKSDARPLSPHLQVWRWHVTMASSIFHRATGVALYGGALGFAGWLGLAAFSPNDFATVAGLLAQPLGQLVLFGLALSLFYHLANGVRHLIWDLGSGLSPKAASASSWLVIGFSVIATAALWALALGKGG